MGMKSCFFIGHREASEEIYPVLYAAVEQHCHIIRQSGPFQHSMDLMEHSIRQGWNAFRARLQL